MTISFGNCLKKGKGKGKGNGNGKGKSKGNCRSLRDDKQKRQGKGKGEGEYRDLSTALRFGRDDDVSWRVVVGGGKVLLVV
ncbi:MAG: hypothetical protein WBY53_10815 [Acidobacteriaceae bacterium]